MKLIRNMETGGVTCYFEGEQNIVAREGEEVIDSADHPELPDTVEQMDAQLRVEAGGDYGRVYAHGDESITLDAELATETADE